MENFPSATFLSNFLIVFKKSILFCVHLLLGFVWFKTAVCILSRSCSRKFRTPCLLLYKKCLHICHADGSQCHGNSCKYLLKIIMIIRIIISLYFRKVKKGSLLIDSSTIDPAVSKELAKAAEKTGAVFMDAPVSGGKSSLAVYLILDKLSFCLQF